MALLERFVKLQCDILILPTTLSEFALLSSSRIGLLQTQEAIETIPQSGYVIPAITDETTQSSVSLYTNQTSKEESLFDCFVMVAARKYRADCIFSFDKGYFKNGFVLIQEFFELH